MKADTKVLIAPRAPCAARKADRAWLFAAGCIIGILTVVQLPWAGGAAARTVRVGVYDNPPKVGLADNGAPQGIFMDILKHIAKRERWEIEYVPGTWGAGLTRLERDSIDLMPDVAYAEARSRRFDFNQLVVLGSWLQVFARKDNPMESVSALEGKRLAVLEGSVQQQACEELRGRLGLSFQVAAYPDYEVTVMAVEGGMADALVASRFFGYRRQAEGGLVPTGVILEPTTLHFAVARGRNHDLLDAIDRHLAVMKNDPRSPYYRSLALWLSEKPRSFVPGYLVWSIASSVLGLLLLLVVSLILRWQVRKRTAELRQRNAALVTALQDLKTAQDEAIKRERLYAVGMTEEVREKCIQPFFTTKGAQGTGMGLTMASNTVAERGGRLQIVSEVSAGTSIIVTLPALGTTGAPKE